MKKKIITAAVGLTALLLCVTLAVGALANPKILTMKAEEVFITSSSDDADWKTIGKEEVVLENENILFTMDGKTTHFTVTDKGSGAIYDSVVRNEEEIAADSKKQSEVIITYYNANSVEMSMNAYENCIEGESFEIKTDGSAIRVYYSIQKSKKRIFVPTVLSAETFEEILQHLESGPKRRLKGFYTLKESEGIYELNDTAGEHNYSEITGYMDAAGYTAEDYAKEAEKLGIDNSAAENMPAAFRIPVEYALTESGFTATVLTDRITSDSDNYKLTNVKLLPYFGACGESEDGWLLVPDGSGAIIELSEKQGVTYSQGIYGSDLAVESSIKPVLMQNAGLAVYAFCSGESAFMAEVTGAAAVAAISAETYGKEITQTHIYTDFNVRSFDSSNMGAMQNQAAFHLYASGYVTEFPQVTYTLFGDKDTTYSDMAHTLQKQWIDRGILGERLSDSQQIPIYLDFTGYETIEESFLGISVEGQTVLSSISDISAAVKELESRGITGFQLRLRAYSNGGVYGKVSNGLALDKNIGTTKEVETLAKMLLQKNGRLYLENNISTVFETGNGFSKMTHAVRSLKKTVLETIDYDLIARTWGEAENEFYLTSPAYFLSLTENFAEGWEKESGDCSVYGYSWSDFGSKLYSDFHANTPYDRTQSMYAAIQAVQKAKDTFGKVITDGSNAYVLSQADAVLNIPLRSSALSCESYSVPFYQMVIHGYKDYAGAPMNIGADVDGNYLASVESGANLYYSFYTSDKNPLKETQAGTLVYPTYITASYDTVEAQYREFTEMFGTLRTQTISSHEKVGDQTFVTTYEDGTQIAVNYSEKDTMVKGWKVPARGFVVLEEKR